MDECSRKRSAGGRQFSRRNSSNSLRETNREDKSVRYCYRLGCGARPDSMKGTPVDSKEKPKHSKPTFNSMGSQSTGGSSCKPFSSSNLRKPRQEKVETNSSKQKETEKIVSEVSSKTTSRRSVVSDSSVNKTPTAQKSEASSSRPCKQIGRRVGSNSQDIPSTSSSSILRPLVTRSPGSGPPRNGVKVLSSSSTDVLPSGCSDCGQNKRASPVRKGPSNRESSLVGGKSIGGSSSGSISVRKGAGCPQQAPRRAQLRRSSRDVPFSVRTRPGGVTGGTRPGGVTGGTLPELEYDSTGPSPIFQSFHFEQPIPTGWDSDEHLGDIDEYRSFNINGFAQALLELARNHGDDRLLFGGFFGGFSVQDEHGDMRLDTDDMTYEELLALGDIIGSVSTGLCEETFSKCVKRSTYMPSSKFTGTTACEDEDIKCSICQEEYAVGDEVGKLVCAHWYHVDCIHEWLTQKNWCPMCKSPAASLAEEIKD